MNNNHYQVVIGIEIHLELNTKTKMFSSAANSFGLGANTAVSVVDLAYPGVLPTLNQEAVVKAVKLAKALQMKIDPLIRFDRKHYFYFDLPKNFQITQQKHPFALDGMIPLSPTQKVKIQRFHLEEDTAKSAHFEAETLLNYNRAGVPLIEIVTDPVIGSADEAVAYIEAIKQLAQALDISEAKLEEGSLRADINISVRKNASAPLGTKVEIKNLNSLGNVRKAIELEVAEQISMLNSNKAITQATKRFAEAKQQNEVLRIKTSEIDYRYYPEPNIVPIKLNEAFIKNITIPQLPWEQKSKYLNEGIDENYVVQLQNDATKAALFDQIDYPNKAALARVFFAEIVQLANAQGVTVDKLNIKPHDITEALQAVDKNIISGKQLKTLLPLLQNSHRTVTQIIKDEKMAVISDKAFLTTLIERIINKNIDFIKSNIDRKERVIKFIVGEVMKETKGQADPIVSSQIASAKIDT